MAGVSGSASLGGAGFESYPDAVAGAEGDGGERDYGMAFDQAEAVVLGDGGENEGGFHECEGIADALAGAAAEGEVSEAWETF